MSCFPFRACMECLQGPSFSATESYAHLREELHSVRLDINSMGPDAVLLKGGTRLCGTGGVLATAPLVQNKSYFQINIQQDGIWGIGVATRQADLSKAPIVEDSWMLHHDGRLMANGEEVGVINVELNEGDNIGITYDHIDLKFYKGEEELPLSISNIRGQVYPCAYVDDGAILDFKFRTFDLNPPRGFEEIMLEQTLL